jgi:hypothetical protein
MAVLIIILLSSNESELSNKMIYDNSVEKIKNILKKFKSDLVEN